MTYQQIFAYILKDRWVRPTDNWPWLRYNFTLGKFYGKSNLEFMIPKESYELFFWEVKPEYKMVYGLRINGDIKTFDLNHEFQPEDKPIKYALVPLEDL